MSEPEPVSEPSTYTIYLYPTKQAGILQSITKFTLNDNINTIETFNSVLKMVCVVKDNVEEIQITLSKKDNNNDWITVFANSSWDTKFFLLEQ